MKSAEGLKQLLKKSQIDLESECARRLIDYLELLIKWNRRINLTATTDWPYIEPLFREGIWASEFYPLHGITHLDIGSGAGFPAMILGILIPRIELELVESRAKRCAFLETAAYTLGMKNLRVYNKRLDAFLSDQTNKGMWDCVSWKGLKLNANNLFKLREHAYTNTQFWMFHGKEPALDTPDVIKSMFKLIRSEKFSSKQGWALSIYLPQ